MYIHTIYYPIPSDWRTKRSLIASLRSMSCGWRGDKEVTIFIPLEVVIAMKRISVYRDRKSLANCSGPLSVICAHTLEVPLQICYRYTFIQSLFWLLLFILLLKFYTCLDYFVDIQCLIIIRHTYRFINWSKV